MPHGLRQCCFLQVAFLSLGSVGLVGFAADSPAPDVDTAIVLQVGSVGISRYAVEKNFARFSGPNGDRRPSPIATCHWFELYLARQVVIAEALREGYAERPEVRELVDRMERHMLGQMDPVVVPPTEAELQAAYERGFGPPVPGRVAFAAVRSGLEHQLLQERRVAAREEQRRRALEAVGLKIDLRVIEQVVQRIRAGRLTAAEIPAGLVASLAGERLASYRLDGREVVLSVEDWRNRFNALFVRHLPANSEELETGIQDLAIADGVAGLARARGADRAPRFVEDRRNFLYYQALDLFEKERLRPRIEVSDAEATAYYRAHASEFARPVRARGTLLRFANEAAAAAWLRERKAAPPSGDEIEVSALSPLPGAVRATEVILRLPDGATFGPVSTPSGALIFVKRTAETELSPYAAVAAQVRNKLTLARLETLELAVAREWAAHHAITDRLPLADFGVDGLVRKPWVALN